MSSPQARSGLDDLTAECQSIADDIGDPCRLNIEDYEECIGDSEGGITDGYMYILSALDIKFIVDREGCYVGAEILICYGGPNIYINTRTQTVDGYWWGKEVSINYTDTLGIYEGAEELMPTLSR